MQLAGKMCMKYLKLETHLLFLLCTILISFESLNAQVPFKIFLVGDAGDHKQPGLALKNVQKELLDNPNSAVIFLEITATKTFYGTCFHTDIKDLTAPRTRLKK